MRDLKSEMEEAVCGARDTLNSMNKEMAVVENKNISQHVNRLNAAIKDMERVFTLVTERVNQMSEGS